MVKPKKLINSKNLNYIAGSKRASSDVEALGFFVIMFIIIGFFVSMGVFSSEPYHKDKYYKQGQVDAINGVIKYTKTEHPDQTVTWELIKEKDEPKM